MLDERLVFSNGQDFQASLNQYTLKIVEHVLNLDKNNVIDRIWKNDHTVWSTSPEELSNRLGWLQTPNVMGDAVFAIQHFVDEIRESNFKKAVLLGMGGSSLAPEVFGSIFGTKVGFLNLAVLDSTDPGAVLGIARESNIENTLFIVSTKSGSTVETISFMKYFYRLVLEKIGYKETGNHFIAITDPGSGLQKTAKELNFRKIFLNDPTIGGRYSALSYFGLVPAAFLGMDISKLLEAAKKLAVSCRETVLLETGKNTAAWLGAILGGFAQMDIDKLTFVISSSLKNFGSWIEQLVAESTGKSGKGILPVCCSNPFSPDAYSKDRLYIYIKVKGDDEYDRAVHGLEKAGYPIVRIFLDNTYDIGGEMFRWEVAIAVAGFILKINPFDQPDVESAKRRGRELLFEFKESGQLPNLPVTLESEGLKIYSSDQGISAKEIVGHFLEQLKSGEKQSGKIKYLAVHAYLNPSEENSALLRELTEKIQHQYGVAVTFGYGPRFLHSTGQLHKGDSGNGLFIQLLADMPEDCPIPDDPKDKASSISFGTLKTAQALGDRQALIDAGRKVMTIDLGKEVDKGIKQLTNMVD